MRTVAKSIFSHAFSRDFSELREQVDISIDSRKITPGAVFFALKGHNFDGHDFIRESLSKGASLIVCDQNFPIDGPNIIKTQSALKSLQLIAKLHLESFTNLTKIAITGSNGKTTTKEMLSAALNNILGEKKIFASSGNFNNHIGLPLDALLVNKDHQIAVFEMGMNGPGEIRDLCQIVKPQYGLITNINNAHEGNFPTGIMGIKMAKGELFDAIKNEGHAIVNLDDKLICELIKEKNITRFTSFAKNKNADIILQNNKFIDNYRQNINIIDTQNNTEKNFSIPLLGCHNAINATAILAIIKALGLCISTAAKGLANMQIVKGRMQFLSGINDSIVINDGYNANPVSIEFGISTCAFIKAKRKIAVIGSMGELGKNSYKHHFELGQKLSKEFDLLYLCGENRKDILAGAISVDFIKENIYIYNFSKEIINDLSKAIKKGDLVFIKGSNSQNMQLIADNLTT